MFTVKVGRRDKSGNSKCHLYEAVSVEIFHNGLHERNIETSFPCVVFQTPSGREQCIIAENSGDYSCDAIYIENCNGKTTDIVRAKPRNVGSKDIAA